MAKLFYTLDEAAQKLRKSADEVLAMAKAGQLQELKDKDQVLFRRSAIDQLAAEDEGGELNLDNFDAGSSGSDIRLGGSSVGGEELRLDGDMNLADGTRAPHVTGGADDSMTIGLADSSASAHGKPVPGKTAPGKTAPGKPAAGKPAQRTGSPSASASGSASGMGLADSNADSMMMDGPAGSGARAKPDDSMSLGTPGNTSLETVGSGSGLLDISSDESFFGAQMIEESLGGDEHGALPTDAGDIFGGGEAAASEEASPVTAGTTGVTFGSATLAEAHDAKFSGFTAGAMVVAAIALVALGWAVIESTVGNTNDVGKMIADNWMYVLGGSVVAVLACGGIGFGIGKATA